MRPDDARLWIIALAASLLLSVLLLLVAALTVTLLPTLLRKDESLTARAAARPEPPATVVISPEMIQKITENAAAAPKPATPPHVAAPEFARTSEDQRGKRPDTPAFIGERDTEATSDRTPDPNAKPLPSQRGETPRNENDLETTQSNYSDGKLESSGQPAAATAEMTPAPSPPSPPAHTQPEPPAPENPLPDPASAKSAPPVEPAKTLGDMTKAEVPAATELLQGPNPVDVNVPKPAPAQSPPPKPTAPPAEETAKATQDSKPPTPSKTLPKPSDAGFRGNQRKTAIQGSISRTGRSALDVADTPLGRYQAAISRAVEQEWQRNCVRHRDFITPGFLTVRFYIQPDGKVKSVQFVGDMQTSEIQKGFTLSSIRDAAIPPMPKEIRTEYREEPLELIFNFYF